MTGFPLVPGYEIQSELGRGGMAIVYSAIETGLDREVAIKVVRGADGDEVGSLQRLENEARGLAALHHPHIVDLYRFGRTADGALFYVMPLMSGGSLEDWPKPAPEERVVALLDSLLDALGHAHAADIIHRDIKPANILFDRHDRPQLADFGAAFMRQRASRITTHGGAIGSSGYMSPEQARGQEVDARSDLYSTAVLAFELLTGRRPFEGPDDLATALAQLEKPVPRLPEWLRHWQAFFDRALAVNPAQRFADANAMRAAIGNLYEPPKLAPTRSWMPIALIAGIVVLGVVAMTSWRSRTSSQPAPAAVVVAAPRPAEPVTTSQSEVEPAPAPEAPPELAKEAPATPVAVDRFADDGGPALVLAREAKGSHPGLAIMAAAVDAPLYRRFAKSRGRTPVACASASGGAQGCLDLATATDIASWLSDQTGEHYRVPTRKELDASIAHVATAPSYAWTSTCNEVRVARPANVAKRSWSRLRKWVGKPRPQEYDIRCDGHFTLKLDGHGDAAKVQAAATPETAVVLVREVKSKHSR